MDNLKILDCLLDKNSYLHLTAADDFNLQLLSLK